MHQYLVNPCLETREVEAVITTLTSSLTFHGYTGEIRHYIKMEIYEHGATQVVKLLIYV